MPLLTPHTPQEMRPNFDKKHYTKTERIFIRTLQELRIPFKSKVKIEGREIDFLIGKHAIEINGHEQDATKNEMLVKLGYTPIHLHNLEITKETIIKLINQL